MADRRVTFLIGANIQNFTKNLNKAQRTFRNFGRDMQRLGTKMTAGLTVPLLGAGTLAVKTAADYETLRQSIDILTGSAEEGARVFERLKQFSARTPFQLKDIARANQTLMGFGQSADEAFESLKMIGDIAAVTGGDMQAISVAFGQAAAEGRLMTRDIRQLINQGVPAIQILADSMGVATSEILDLASQGQITFDVLVKAFRQATNEGGLFADGMKKQSQTVAGLFSTLRDNVSIFLGEIGNAIIDTFDLRSVLANLTGTIQNMTKQFNQLSERTRKHIFAVAGLLTAGGPLLVALGIASKAVAGFVGIVTSKFTLIIGVIGTLVVSMQWLADNWDTLMSHMAKQTESWARATNNIFSLFAKTASFFGRAMPGAMNGYFAAMDEAIMVLQNLGKDGSNDFTTFGQAGLNAFRNIQKGVQGLMNVMSGGSLNEFLEWLRSATGAANSAGNAGSGVGEGQVDIGMASFLQNAIPQIDLTEYRANLNEALSLWDKFKVGFKEIGGDLQAFLANEITGAVLSFSDALGKSLSGATNNFATTFEKIILIVLDFAKSLARLAAGIGAVMLFIPGMQGAGAGLLAAAAALNAIVSGVTAGINKRIANREQRAQSPGGTTGGSQSFASPAMAGQAGGGSITENVQFVIRGSDLVSVINRTQSKQR